MTTPSEPVWNDAKVPLFDLDLGGNGGRLAPLTAGELINWVTREIEHWSPIERGGQFNLQSSGMPLGELQVALQTAEAAGTNQPGSAAFAQSVETTKSYLARLYGPVGLPHSSTALGVRVRSAAMSDPQMGAGFLWALTNPSTSHPPLASSASWAGILSGLSQRFGLFPPSNDDIRARNQALVDLQERGELLLGEKRAQLLDLHNSFGRSKESIQGALEKQAKDFDDLVAASKLEHAATLQSATGSLTALETTYNEKLALRAPVEYWKARQLRHETNAKALRRWVTGGFLAMTVGLGLAAAWVFHGVADNGHPDPWKGTLSVLVAVIGVWALRLLIRMYLSDVHLGVDAAERVTMVNTYLALLEGKNLPTDDDRKLILQSLFRPASDGMVKEEGVPHAALEWLTKQGR